MTEMTSNHDKVTIDPNAVGSAVPDSTNTFSSRNVSKRSLQNQREDSDTTDVERRSRLSLTSDSSKEIERTANGNNPTSENEKTAEETIDAAEDHDGDDEVVYPAGLKLFLISIALCLSVFLVALDNTIIATAIPKITDRFQSLNDVGWYASSYLLTTCALQLFFGK